MNEYLHKKYMIFTKYQKHQRFHIFKSFWNSIWTVHICTFKKKLQIWCPSYCDWMWSKANTKCTAYNCTNKECYRLLIWDFFSELFILNSLLMIVIFPYDVWSVFLLQWNTYMYIFIYIYVYVYNIMYKMNIYIFPEIHVFFQIAKIYKIFCSSSLSITTSIFSHSNWTVLITQIVYAKLSSAPFVTESSFPSVLRDPYAEDDLCDLDDLSGSRRDMICVSAFATSGSIFPCIFQKTKKILTYKFSEFFFQFKFSKFKK